uniref:Homeobox domain-containing protein n=1 Tax=Parascaris equorum TaxID=6256 RepID=A0A914RKY9_PAREQ
MAWEGIFCCNFTIPQKRFEINKGFLTSLLTRRSFIYRDFGLLVISSTSSYNTVIEYEKTHSFRCTTCGLTFFHTKNVSLILVFSSTVFFGAQIFLLNKESSNLSADYCDDEVLTQSGRSKRMRTSFKHHQLRTMKSYFNLNHNPDAKDLKQLAQRTGLTKRVLQVI